MKNTFSLVLLLIAYVAVAQPKITGFTPNSGLPGTSVTITGSGFSTVANQNIVFFGAVKASITNASSNSITVVVPSGATFKPLTVTTNGLTAFSRKPFVCRTPDSMFSDSSFATAQNIATGAGPISLTIGDFDLDGKADIAVVNDTSNTLTLLRNVSTPGTVQFASPINLATGNRPRAVISNDVDGDGKLDIVLINYNSNQFSVFRNTSTQPGIVSFDSRVDFSTGKTPRSITAGDFDGDGRIDIATMNVNDTTVSVFRNTSAPASISFQPRQTIPIRFYSLYLVAADFNNDNKIDLAVANYSADSTIAFFKNTSSSGAILFTEAAYTGTNNFTNTLNATDIDNDGNIDIAVAGDRFICKKNIGANGTFNFGPLYDKGKFTNYEINAAILNDDDLPDMLTTSNESGGSSIRAFINKSDATGIKLLDVTSFSTQLQPYSIGVSDFDGDKRPDIATANWKSGTLSILKNVSKDFHYSGYFPLSGASGDTIVISGDRLSKVRTVKFGGVLAAAFELKSEQSLWAVVGKGASGDVTISSDSFSVSKPGFTYLPRPQLTSFLPLAAGNGDTIIIAGKFLNDINLVSFGDVPCTNYYSKGTDTIIAILSGAASGSVLVSTKAGTASKQGFTFIPSPTLIDFSLKNALPGQTILIKGKSLATTKIVTIAGKLVPSFQVLSDTTVSVPINSTFGGTVSLTTRYGVAALPGFYNGPVLFGLSAYAGKIGDQITISGSRFKPQLNENTVWFGAAKAEVLKVTENEITVKVPLNAGFDYVSVKSGSLTVFSQKKFLPGFPVVDSFVSWSKFKERTPLSYADRNPFAVAAGDVDADGWPDLAVGDSYVINIYKNYGGSDSLRSFTTLKGDNFDYLAFVDLTGDAKADLIGINYNSMVLFENTSTASKPSFAAPVVLMKDLVYYKRIRFMDMDGDGNSDIILQGSFLLTTNQVILRNLSSPGNVKFDSPYFINGQSFSDIACGDINGDGKSDIVGVAQDSVMIYRNVSEAGKLNFTVQKKLPFTAAIGVELSDIDQDGAVDLMVNSAQEVVGVARQASAPGGFNFQPFKFFSAFAPYSRIYDKMMHDFDGNGKPDFAFVTTSQVMSILFNRSTPGNILFDAPLGTKFEANLDRFDAGDFNRDGKPDLAIVNGGAMLVRIFENQLGSIKSIEICPPIGVADLHADVIASSYQWQVDDGSGFKNISGNTNYIGINNQNLLIGSIPPSWSGYKYRCILDGNRIGGLYELRFVNRWTGKADNNWENPANWDCNSVPDQYTDVVITKGNTIINKSTVIKTLHLLPGVQLVLQPNVELKITN